MIITHKNTGTLGDFSTQLPLLSSLKDKGEYIHLSLPKEYEKFNGLKDLLLYQEFIDEVDFLDLVGDTDIQAHACEEARPCRARYMCKKLGLDINTNLLLQCPDQNVSDEYLQKPIIIDKNTPGRDRPIMKRSNLFPEDKYIYLNFDNHDIIYNINICRKTKQKIFCCLTGFPVLLQFFNDIEFTIVWFSREDQENLSIPFYGENSPYYETYFENKNVKLEYWKDIK